MVCNWTCTWQFENKANTATWEVLIGSAWATRNQLRKHKDISLNFEQFSGAIWGPAHFYTHCALWSCLELRTLHRAVWWIRSEVRNAGRTCAAAALQSTPGGAALSIHPSVRLSLSSADEINASWPATVTIWGCIEWLISSALRERKQPAVSLPRSLAAPTKKSAFYRAPKAQVVIYLRYMNSGVRAQYTSNEVCRPLFFFTAVGAPCIYHLNLCLRRHFISPIVARRSTRPRTHSFRRPFTSSAARARPNIIVRSAAPNTREIGQISPRSRNCIHNSFFLHLNNAALPCGRVTNTRESWKKITAHCALSELGDMNKSNRTVQNK